MPTDWHAVLRRVDEFRWEIPASYKAGMRVPGLVYASGEMLTQIGQDQALEQVANVAMLPGIVEHALAMPDIHWGYGFPVGGVAAMRVEDGVISPGGIGFDINCGVRLLRTNLTEADVRPRLDELLDALFRNVPAGVGSTGRVRLSRAEMDKVLRGGAVWAVENGFGGRADLDVIEAGGRLREADPARVSDRAKERGADQLGTLGSGNHFLEVQVVEEIFAPHAAATMGIREPGQVVVFVHTGSRGLGYQVCEDALKRMDRAAAEHRIELPDRQLACAPFRSAAGQDYFAAMCAAANFAWANRQLITHWTRESFAGVFRKPVPDLGLQLVYDVSHNIAKLETHADRRLLVHRKGATRAFAPGHPEVPGPYRAIGQPVFVPGDMGRYSFVAVGTDVAMRQTFGSTCHGAGRVRSRKAAVRALAGTDVAAELARRDIHVRAVNRRLLAEEASEAYKDVADVVDVCDGAGISRKAVKMRPIGVIKG